MTGALSFLKPMRNLPAVRVDWIGRIPEVPVDGERDAVLERLRSHHDQAVNAKFGSRTWWQAEQVHGNEVARVPTGDLEMIRMGMPVVGAVDGLMTSAPGEVLGIYVADCAAIWLADRSGGAVALLHSGKKGTEGDILGVAVERMRREFGTRPEDLVGVLGPCIRPPDYEVDFAAEIVRQAERAGIGEFHDCGLNTASDPERFYSYRIEKGRTGRMLALIMRESE